MDKVEILDRINVDHFSPVPGFFQIYYEILRLVENDELRPGDMLPTEMQIVTKLGVSRVMVRKAMDKLIQAKVIYRKKAVGTFIVPDVKNVYKSNYGWIPLTVMIETAGKKPRAEVLSIAKESMPIYLQTWLHTNNQNKVCTLKRRFFADGNICCLHFFYHFQNIDWDLDTLGNGSLTKYLGETVKFQIYNVSSSISVDFATREVAHYLDIPKKAPLLRVLSMNRGKYGDVISAEITWYFPEKAVISFSLDKTMPLKWTKLF